MATLNFPLLSGGIPPQPGIRSVFDTIDDMLLYAAWVHGITKGRVVHRLALFSFVHSHIASKPDESLQGIIERSAYWISTNKKDGQYVLNELGYNRSIKLFGPSRDFIDFAYEYSFFKDYKGKRFTVVVDIYSPELKPYVDGKRVNGVQMVKILTDLEAPIPRTQSSQPQKALNWILRSNDYQWTSKHKTIIKSEITIQGEEDESTFPEGKEMYRLHRTKERNPQVIDLAKKRAINKDKLLRCEVCGFSFIETYGEIGSGFIEAHHNKPLSELNQETETKVEDIALVCSNCHRILHRRRPLLTISDLRTILKAK